MPKIASPPSEYPAAQPDQSPGRLRQILHKGPAIGAAALTLAGTPVLEAPATALAHEPGPDPHVTYDGHLAHVEKPGVLLPDGRRIITHARHRDDANRSHTLRGKTDETAKHRSKHHPKRHRRPTPKPGGFRPRPITPQVPEQAPVIETPLDQFPAAQFTDPMPKELKPAQELIDFHPETIKVKPEAVQWLQNNVVRVYPSGCSGLKVRDPKTNAVTGAEYSVHCGNLAQDGHRKKDADGNPIISLSSPMAVYDGLTEKTLNWVGNADRMALPDDDDLKSDQAYIAFPGFDIQKDVLANSNQMTPEEIAQLKPGDIVYGGGWPVSQSGNPGSLKMETFAMVVMGIETWTITNGEQIQVLVTAMPENADNAGCTPGFSGTVAVNGEFTPDGPPPRTIGSAGGYISFNPDLNPYGAESALNSLRYAEWKYGVAMKGFSGLCGFSIKQPTAENGAIFPKVVVEGHQADPSEQFLSQTITQFTNPETTHRSYLRNSHIPFNDGKETTTLKDPAYAYDPITDTLILLADGDEGKGGLIIRVVPNASKANLPVYRHQGQDPSLGAADGTLGYDDDAHEFVINGQHFGGSSNDTPPDGDLADRIIVKDGKIALMPVGQKAQAVRSNYSFTISR